MNGDKYVGNHENGKGNGQGTITWADGETYTGEWKDGNKHGEGTITWANGEKEVVRRNQVTFNATYTTLNVVGLSKKNLNLTLTALCKRTKLTSKEKTISRCNSLIVLSLIHI